MVIVTEAGKAKVIVETASVQTEAALEEWVNWSFRIHNTGETGIMGGMVQNYSGPDSVRFKWREDEQELPVSGSLGKIIYYVEPQPNCKRLEENGQLKFKTAGTYKIRILGVHRENGNWYYDDYREFTVKATEAPPPPPKTWWEKFVELWNSLSTEQKILVVSAPSAAVGVTIALAARKK